MQWMLMMLKLPDVTLCSVFTKCHDLTRKAVYDCLSKVQFGDVKLFTDEVVTGSYIEYHVPAFKSFDEAGRFTVYDLPRCIGTSHVLFIHWDSWIVDSAMWMDAYLDYDYIGAPWWYRDGLNVGNSGFCLRSKRLMDFLAAHSDEFPLKAPEDDTLCRQYRPRLEKLGFKWAPDLIAHAFSVERVRACSRSFGFHGMFCWPDIMTDGQIEERLSGAPEYVTGSIHHSQMRMIMANRAANKAA